MPTTNTSLRFCGSQSRCVPLKRRIFYCAWESYRALYDPLALRFAVASPRCFRKLNIYRYTSSRFGWETSSHTTALAHNAPLGTPCQSSSLYHYKHRIFARCRFHSCLIIVRKHCGNTRSIKGLKHKTYDRATISCYSRYLCFKPFYLRLIKYIQQQQRSL